MRLHPAAMPAGNRRLPSPRKAVSQPANRSTNRRSIRTRHLLKIRVHQLAAVRISNSPAEFPDPDAYIYRRPGNLENRFSTISKAISKPWKNKKTSARQALSLNFHVFQAISIHGLLEKRFSSVGLEIAIRERASMDCLSLVFRRPEITCPTSADEP